MSGAATQTSGRQALQDLRVRGVSNPDEFVSLDDTVIAEEIQKLGRNAKPGLLVYRLRARMKRVEVEVSPSTVRGDDRMRLANDWVVQNLPDLTARQRDTAVLAAWRVLFRGHQLSQACLAYVQQAVTESEMA